MLSPAQARCRLVGPSCYSLVGLELGLAVAGRLRWKNYIFTFLNYCQTQPFPFLKLQNQSKVAKWEPPPNGVYKINSDATFSVATSTGGWGFVVRDNEGTYLEGGRCGNTSRMWPSSIQAETLAVLFTLEKAVAIAMGMPRIIFENRLDNNRFGPRYRWELIQTD